MKSKKNFASVHLSFEEFEKTLLEKPLSDLALEELVEERKTELQQAKKKEKELKRAKRKRK